MPRIKPVNKNPDNESLTDKQSKLLNQVEQSMGSVPNILGTMAHAPSVLQAYLGFSKAMGESSLPATLREQIALVISQKNGCSYCLAAHTEMGKSSGLSERACEEAREGNADDSKSKAALGFAVAVLESHGYVTDADLEAMREAGYDNSQILEVVALVAMNIFTNMFNHVVETEVDFPRVNETQLTRP